MRRAVLSVCCAGLILGSMACSGTHHRASSPSTTAEPSLDRDKYGWYRLAVGANAKCAPAAAADIRKAIAIDPHFEPALYLYGVMQYNASDWNSADSYLRKAVAMNPHDAHAHWVYGLALAHNHGYRADSSDPATKQLNEALRLDPSLRRPSATSQLLNPGTKNCRSAAH